MRTKGVLTGAVLLILGGCSGMMTKIAANGTVGVLKKATAAFDEEKDPILARAAATANLKFFDGVLKATPENGDLMVMIAKNYALYSFAFLEDDMEQETYGSPKYEEAKTRAMDYYRRAMDSTIARLEQDFEDFRRAAEGQGDRLDQILAECDEDQLPALYWLAYGWGSLTQLSQDPDLLTDLPKIKKIMGWVRDHDGSYENGAPNLFFGAVEMALPKALGGNPEASKAAFDKGVAVTGGKFLMGKALYARFYMLPTNDKAGYVKLLTEVVDAPDDVMPSQRLANELAKMKARRWLADADKAFEDAPPEPAPEEPPPEPPVPEPAPGPEGGK